MKELFSLTFPNKEICSEEAMYVRLSEQNAFCDGDGIVFSNGGNASFNTYFNALACRKYTTYCNIDTLFATVDFCGDFIFEIYGATHKKENDIPLVQQRICSQERTTIKIEIPRDAYNRFDMIYMRFNSQGEGRIFGGSYTALEGELPCRVSIAVVICTYKREKYVLRNLRLIQDFLQKSKYFKNDDIHFYVIDNGHTLSPDNIENSFVSLYKNKNCGGSAGFTRGLLEAGHSDRNHTHVLFMDDDVLLDCHVFAKLYMILCLRKNEYKNMSIGGTMIRLSDKITQHEAGAIWDGKRIINLGKNMKLTEWSSVLHNEDLQKPNYNAWWFCCFPITCLYTVGCPLPLFIKTDDIEYGLRNNGDILIMNGISVWHEDFEGKYDGFVEYYIKRNELILTAMQEKKDYTAFQIVKLFKSVSKQLVFQRYFIADLIFKAYEDFLKGADFLLQTDGEQLNKELMQACPLMLDSETLQKNGTPFNEASYLDSLVPIKSKPIQLLTLNGYLLPQYFYKTRKNGCHTVDAARCIPSNFFLHKRVLHWDASRQKGYVTVQKRTALIKYAFKLLSMSFCMLFGYKKALNSYRMHKKELTSEEFWHLYLNL